MTEQSLTFRDRWMREYGGSISEECTGLNPVQLNNDEAAAIVLELTSDEFNKLLSAVQTGAQLLWPDEQYEIIWSLLKGVECSLEFCERTAECIYNSQAVHDALVWQLIGLGLLDGDGQPIGAITGSKITPTGTGCSDSDRYGMALEIVAALDRLTTDMFETLTPSTEVIEVATDLLNIIPVLGPLLAAAFDVAAFLITYSASVYAAAYSAAVQSDIACALLCYFEDCDLTFGNVMECYRGILGPFTPPGAFTGMSDLANWLATVTLNSDLGKVAAVHYLILTAFAAGSTVNLAKPNLLAAAAYGADPEDPSGVCDACDGCWGWGDGFGNDSEVDIKTGSWGETGTYNSTNHRWEGVWNGVHGSAKWIYIELPNDGTYWYSPTSIKVFYDVHHTRGAAGVLYVGTWDPSGGDWQILLYENHQFPPDGAGVFELTGIDIPGWINSAGPLRVYLGARCWDDDAACHAYITGIEICGSRVEG